MQVQRLSITVSPGLSAYDSLLLLAGIVFSEGCAQYFIKQSKCTKDRNYCLVALGFYAVVVALLYATYDHVPMGMLTALWSALSIVTVSVIGAVAYHERLKPLDYAGFGMIVTGVLLIFVAGHDQTKAK